MVSIKGVSVFTLVLKHPGADQRFQPAQWPVSHFIFKILWSQMGFLIKIFDQYRYCSQLID